MTKEDLFNELVYEQALMLCDEEALSLAEELVGDGLALRLDTIPTY